MCESDKAYPPAKDWRAGIYLAQMYRPGFRTINDFRKDDLDKIREYFVGIVRMCKGLGMVKVGEISIEGTKIKANASKRRTKDKKVYERWLECIEEEIKEILKKAGEIEEVIADCGYPSYDNYEYLQKRGKTGYMADQFQQKQGQVFK